MRAWAVSALSGFCVADEGVEACRNDSIMRTAVMHAFLQPHSASTCRCSCMQHPYAVDLQSLDTLL